MPDTSMFRLRAAAGAKSALGLPSRLGLGEERRIKLRPTTSHQPGASSCLRASGRFSTPPCLPRWPSCCSLLLCSAPRSFVAQPGVLCCCRRTSTCASHAEANAALMTSMARLCTGQQAGPWKRYQQTDRHGADRPNQHHRKFKQAQCRKAWIGAVGTMPEPTPNTPGTTASARLETDQFGRSSTRARGAHGATRHQGRIACGFICGTRIGNVWAPRQSR